MKPPLNPPENGLRHRSSRPPQRLDDGASKSQTATQARAQTAGNTPGVNVAPVPIVHTSETIVQFYGCDCGRRVPPKRAAARFSVYDGYDDEGKPYACVAIRMLHDWPCAIRFDLARAARWGTGKREVARP